MNKLYIRGKAREHRIKNRLKAKGYIVLRTAGSKGFADLIAISKEDRTIRFIQCKPDESRKKALEAEYSWISGEFWASFEVKSY